MIDDIDSPEGNGLLQDKEVREHIEHLRIRHAQMMGHPPPPLRPRRVRMRQNRPLPAPRKLRDPKRISTTIRLHPYILEAFKAGGPGWQTRINEALLKLVKTSA